MTTLCRTFLKSTLAPAILLGSLVGHASADDVATDAKPADQSRPVVRDQRPDTSRGWMVFSKAAYWPLCYESLDRIKEAKQLIGSDAKEETADAFEKCAAWLNVAASAAMTDGTAGITETADLLQDAANAFREGEAWSDAELTDATTLGLIAMAKSHVLRAEAPDLEYKAPTASTSTAATSVTDAAKELEQEIATERRALAVAQYRHDAIESQRHLNVAQEYLTEAGRIGNFELSPSIASPIPDLKGTTAAEMSDYVSDEVRPRIVAMKSFIAEKRTEFRDKLADRM